jgi:hypothetical protein
VTASDPSDQAGNGRGGSGVTDSDPSDRAGNGRGGGNPRYTGRTDSDSGASSDRSGYGRTGLTDSDNGSNADRAGYGRGR